MRRVLFILSLLLLCLTVMLHTHAPKVRTAFVSLESRPLGASLIGGEISAWALRQHTI